MIILIKLKKESCEWSISLTPDARPLVGDVVLQLGPEACLSSSTAYTPIIHQQEGLVVVVEATGVAGRVLDVVLGGEAALRDKRNTEVLCCSVS